MNYNELIQLYFERSNALQGYWNLYVVVVGGLLAFSSLRKQPAAITTMIVTVLLGLFAYENHDAIQIATGQRLATHEAIAKFDPGATGPTGKQVRDILEPTLAPALQFCMALIAENLERVREQIAQAAAKAGRSADELELVAISKTHDAAKVREAIEAGQRLFGESRVQEARAKIPELASNLRWHFVGHLQKNKIRHALPLFELTHSVDSLALAEDVNRIAEEDGLHPRILLEINVAGEGSKFGFQPDRLRAEMESLLALPRLSILGLMTIPPIAEEAEASRKYFVQLRELRARLQTEFHVDLAQMSMGMTQDFAVAVEEGATLVRVGTAIFGERSKLKRE